MTSEERAMVEGCRQAPEDNAPRLVYADWLDEHDQPDQAELIRLQVERAQARFPANEVTDRETEVLTRVLGWSGADWLPPGRRTAGVEVAFVRGFPLDVTVGPTADAAVVRDLLSDLLVRRLTVRDREDLPALLAAPLCGLETFTLKWSPRASSVLTVDGARAVVASAPGLQELVVQYGTLDVAAAEALTGLGQLKILNFSGTDMFAGAVGHLASVGWPNLAFLRLAGVELGYSGVAEIGTQGVPSTLRYLDLPNNLIDPAGARVLANMPGLHGLMGLDLCNNLLGVEGVMHLVRGAGLGSECEIHLLGNQAGRAGRALRKRFPHACLRW